RADVDAFALHSQQKAAKAIEEKRFGKSLFQVKNDDGSPGLDRDEHPRADTTTESLGALQPAFVQMGAMPMGPNGETVDQLAIKKAGMTVGDVDLWEINEAFAVVPLQTIRKLGIDPARVNVNGGAIALGHPLGATGAILLGTALDELERTGKATALITLCIGGGQGIATVIERV